MLFEVFLERHEKQKKNCRDKSPLQQQEGDDDDDMIESDDDIVSRRATTMNERQKENNFEFMECKFVINFENISHYFSLSLHSFMLHVVDSLRWKRERYERWDRDKRGYKKRNSSRRHDVVQFVRLIIQNLKITQFLLWTDEFRWLLGEFIFKNQCEYKQIDGGRREGDDDRKFFK